MKVSIKTLEGRQFDLEVEGSDTVRAIAPRPVGRHPVLIGGVWGGASAGRQVDALKQKIETEHSIAVDTQKLIFKGKILAEGAKTMDDYGIKDKDFLVIMVSKVLFCHSALTVWPGGIRNCDMHLMLGLSVCVCARVCACV